mmetsp:Transcript_27233/g.31080  ORF Transcript_27233/g.31080 Transcript_27233/m.31080 type:complete len:271 (+) Transcript_27233:41-853(+)
MVDDKTIINNVQQICQQLQNNELQTLKLPFHSIGLKSCWNPFCEALRMNTTLISLNLSNNLWPDLSNSDIVFPPSLRELDLSSTGIKGEYLGAIPSLVHLKCLDLSDNLLTSQDMMFLVRWLPSRLETLYLANNLIGKIGIMQLVERYLTMDHQSSLSLSSSPPCRTLRCLDLRGNFGTHHALSALSELVKQQCELTNIFFDHQEQSSSIILSELQYWLDLNRFGRRCMKDYTLLSALWPAIFEKAARSSPLVLYTLLQERPDTLIKIEN